MTVDGLTHDAKLHDECLDPAKARAIGKPGSVRALRVNYFCYSELLALNHSSIMVLPCSRLAKSSSAFARRPPTLSLPFLRRTSRFALTLLSAVLPEPSGVANALRGTDYARELIAIARRNPARPHPDLRQDHRLRRQDCLASRPAPQHRNAGKILPPNSVS